jgi:hypothetical protein
MASFIGQNVLRIHRSLVPWISVPWVLNGEGITRRIQQIESNRMKLTVSTALPNDRPKPRSDVRIPSETILNLGARPPFGPDSLSEH